MKIIRNEFVQQKHELLREIGAKEPTKEQTRQLAELDVKIMEFLKAEMKNAADNTMALQDKAEKVQAQAPIVKKSETLRELKVIYDVHSELIERLKNLKTEMTGFRATFLKDKKGDTHE